MKWCCYKHERLFDLYCLLSEEQRRAAKSSEEHLIFRKKRFFTCCIRHGRIREKVIIIVLYHIVYHNCADWCEGGSVYYCGCCMAMFSRSILLCSTWNRLPLKVRTATSTEQFSRALKTQLFTLDWSCGSPRRLWLFISTDELWRRIQIEWLIDWLFFD